MAHGTKVAIVGLVGWLVGCGGATRDARTIPTAGDTAGEVSEQTGTVDEDEFTRVRETLNRLGAADHATAEVVLDVNMGHGFAYAVDEASDDSGGGMYGGGGQYRDAFGETIYVHGGRELAWAETLDEARAIFASFESDPYMMQRFETFGAAVAALARNAERASQHDVARALYRLALEAPHESRPSIDSSPADRLVGDIALMALRRAIRKYSNDGSFTRSQFRALLAEIAAIPDVEAATRARELLVQLDIMISLEAQTPAADREQLTQYWEHTYSLSSLTEQPLATAMETLEPLLSSEHLTRVGEHMARETDLRRLKNVVVDIIGQLAGREVTSVEQAREWWEEVRADGGVGESFAFLEQNQDQSMVDYRLATHVVRLYRADAAAADVRVRRIFRRATPAFKTQLLHAFMGLRDLDESTLRPYVLDSMGSEDRQERAAAVMVAAYRGTPSDEFLDRMAAMLPAAVANRTEYDELLSTLVSGLLNAGRVPVVMAHWDELPHRLRSQIAMSIPTDVEPDVVRPALLAEGTLALGSPAMGCVTITTADYVYAARRAAAGDTVDCETRPDERRAAREREAGGPTTDPRALTTLTGEGIRVDVEGYEPAATALQAAGVEASADGLRRMIVGVIRTRSTRPSMAIFAFRRRGETVDVEIRIRNTNTSMGGLSNLSYTRAGTDSEMVREGMPVSPASATFSGAAPYEWMVESFEKLFAGELDAVYLETRW